MNIPNQIALETATEAAEWDCCNQPKGLESPWEGQKEEEKNITRYFRHSQTNQVVATIKTCRGIKIIPFLPPREKPYPEETTLPTQREKTTWSIASSLRKELLSDDPGLSKLMLVCICAGLFICAGVALVAQTDFGDRRDMTKYILASATYLMIFASFTGVYLIKRLHESRIRRKKERNSRRYEEIATKILQTGIIPDNISGETINPATRRKIEKILAGKKTKS